MATLTAPPQSAAPLPVHASAPAVVRIEPPRGWLGVSRAAVFFRDARYQDPLQADGHRSFVGGAAAANDHGRVHDFFRAPGETAFAGTALSGVLFRGAGAMGVFFAGARQLHEYRGGQPKRDHESVFSAADPASGCGVFGTGGFRDWPGGDGGADAVVWNPSAGDGAAAAGVDCAGGAHGAWRLAVDFGAGGL